MVMGSYGEHTEGLTRKVTLRGGCSSWDGKEVQRERLSVQWPSCALDRTECASSGIQWLSTGV